MEDPIERVRQAEEFLTAGRFQEAQDIVAKLAAAGTTPPRTFLIYSKCLMHINKLLPALHGASAEVALNPHDPEARKQLEIVRDALRVPTPSDPLQREFRTVLSREAIDNIEGYSQHYTYRDIPMIKNVFDLALYPLLLWKQRPATIIEIGSYFGGSAVWLADQTMSFGLETRVYSIDPHPVTAATHPRVTFLKGDGQKLGETLSESLLASLPRPWLVIDDADHSQQTTAAVLQFFHPLLRAGDYLVVEDGMSCEGPLAALTEFFVAHGSDYEVDTGLCDFFGYNVTWCVNGYLRRK